MRAFAVLLICPCLLGAGALLGRPAGAAPGADAAAEPAQATITFDEPAYVDMPVWVHVELPAALSGLQANLRYPFWPELWDLGQHDLEVTRDGKPLPRREHEQHAMVRGGLMGGSVAPSTSPRGRLPLHLLYRLDQPGTYQVRYRGFTDELRHNQVVAESPWTRLEVNPFPPEQRRAWVREQFGKMPEDPGMLVGDVIPSVAAVPDEEAVPALVRLLGHRSDLVQKCAYNGLTYHPAPVVDRAVVQAIREHGPTPLLAYVLGWRRERLQAQAEAIVALLLPHLQSDKARALGAAVQSLGCIARHYRHNAASDLPRRITDAVWRSVPYIVTLNETEALHPLALFVGQEKTDRSRELLWQLRERPDVAEQATICLCWIGDRRDLPRLGALLMNDDAVARSLAYHLRRAYGQPAVPYLVRRLALPHPDRVALECAVSLTQEDRVEGFRYLRKAVAGVLRGLTAAEVRSAAERVCPSTARDEALAYLDAQIRRLQAREPRRRSTSGVLDASHWPFDTGMVVDRSGWRLDNGAIRDAPYPWRAR